MSLTYGVGRDAAFALASWRGTNMLTAVRILKLVRKLRPDVVVARDPYSAYWLLSAAVGRLAGARVVYYSQYRMHRQLARWRPPSTQWPRGLRERSGLLRCSARPNVTACIRRTAVRSVRHGATDAAGVQAVVQMAGAVNIMTVGKFYRRKNHVLFLEAIARLAESHSVRATIIGECTTDENRRELTRVPGDSRRAGAGRQSSNQD